MKKTKEIAILLATYNGEKYLREQLDSLYNQTYKNWTLYIHDDGSTDNTLTIIYEYQKMYNNLRVLLFPGGCGAKESFLKMLQMVDADYYLFCDQDDVWLPIKIEQSLSAIKAIEKDKGEETPILVHSDLQVVDADLRTINDSFWDMMLIRPEKLQTFSQLGAYHLVTGCTMLFNKAAKKCAKYPAKYASMHDVWVTLCVSKNKGVIFGIKTPLIMYRQHGFNTLGAKDMRKDSKLTHKLLNLREVICQNYRTYRMLMDLNYGSVFKYLYYKNSYKF